MKFRRKVIALESRLRQCRNVVTLGVCTNFSQYPRRAQTEIRKADIIYYPTTFYADLFDAIGKPTFPSYHHFEFPFIAKVARGSARGEGVFLIRTREDLERYCDTNGVAYIQDYLPIDRDMRVVVIGRRTVHAYWRIAPEADFRSNVSQGARICLDPVPETALTLAACTARACGWDDVGLDICRFKGEFYVLEANMKYGREGFRKAGIDYCRLMEDMIERREI